jgi:adenine-specific DNA-methyltransferase
MNPGSDKGATMSNNQKLELTWIGKDQQPRLEPRILIEDPSKSYGDKNTDNMLIFGDNLLALKALEQNYASKIKCVYIDPPYNTGSAFEHYDDGLEHSVWLSLLRDRIVILQKLLCDSGVAFVQIDDNEHAYLKVIMDEIFGRKNFISTIVWQKKYAVKSDSEFISDSHEYILVFAKNREFAKMNRFPRTDEQDARYKNLDNDPRGLWTSGPLQRNEAREYAIFPIVSPLTGKEHWPPKGTSWRFTKDKIDELINDNRIYFGPDGKNVPRLKRFLSEVSQTVPPTTWWDYKNFGHNDEAKRESKALVGDNETVFATPKPERLIKAIIEVGSSKGDLVLDSFLGSGTTAAVAHKMGRKWIGIELGEHCHTHCIPRLRKVVDGSDQGGISKAVNWKGGGGFKYYYLAPSLLNEDKHGNWVISKEYNPQMLAAAMAKHEGFKYSPDESCYWKQGYSTERDFIFTITNFVNVELLDRIHEEMRPGESLLICCKAFQDACDGRYDNITIKKIPNMLLGRCEFGREDYSLNIVNVPVEAEPESGSEMEPELTPVIEDEEGESAEEQLGLFDKEDR